MNLGLVKEDLGPLGKKQVKVSHDRFRSLKGGLSRCKVILMQLLLIYINNALERIFFYRAHFLGIENLPCDVQLVRPSPNIIFLRLGRYSPLD